MPVGGGAVDSCDAAACAPMADGLAACELRAASCELALHARLPPSTERLRRPCGEPTAAHCVTALALVCCVNALTTPLSPPLPHGRRCHCHCCHGRCCHCHCCNCSGVLVHLIATCTRTPASALALLGSGAHSCACTCSRQTAPTAAPGPCRWSWRRGTSWRGTGEGLSNCTIAHCRTAAHCNTLPGVGQVGGSPTAL